MKTYSARPADVDKKWLLIDAEGLVLGRLASIVAMRIRGKHKPQFTPHIDCGDHVIVVNADKVALTGNKLSDKTYYHHTGWPGGIKERNAGKMLASKRPQEVFELAVRRMMPRGPMGRKQFRNLKVYSGPDHPHEAQAPEVFDVGALNSKNKRSA